MSVQDDQARVGTVLGGKWTLERFLGSGGMASVYAAHHKIGRTAAVKVLHPEIAVDEQVRARFEREATAVNSIGHPGVVEILDLDVTSDGTHYLVMELLDGETLADRCERRADVRLPWLLDMTDQLLDVLIACHEKGIIHRDIKPENLLLLRDGKLKVLDFGIARMRDGLRTQAGTMLGTVAFSAPEQLEGKQVDARADLYSVGATLFTVIAGRRVHQAAAAPELTMKMMTKPAPQLAQVAPKSPEEVCLFIDRALAFLPDHRYPDARTMRSDLWAVKRSERPPYAYACREAGMATDATKMAPPRDDEQEPAAPLPATAPQMPVFADDDAPPAPPDGKLPSTDPQLPAFAANDAAQANEPDADDAGRSGDEAEPSADAPQQQPAQQTLAGGFESPKRWRTDPRWPLPAQEADAGRDAAPRDRSPSPEDEPPPSG